MRSWFPHGFSHVFLYTFPLNRESIGKALYFPYKSHTNPIIIPMKHHDFQYISHINPILPMLSHRLPLEDRSPPRSLCTAGMALCSSFGGVLLLRMLLGLSQVDHGRESGFIWDLLRKSMGKPWENVGKPWENNENIWENVGKQWECMG